MDWIPNFTDNKQSKFIMVRNQVTLNIKHLIFEKAVISRLDGLINEFQLRLEKSADPKRFQLEEFEYVKNIFETQIPRNLQDSARIIKRQALGSNKEDPYLQIKLIFKSRIYGKEYDLHEIDSEDINDIVEELTASGNHYLDNQIWTEAYYKFYKFLESDIEPKHSLESKETTDGLNMTQRMLLISYLQDAGKFPKRKTDQTQKSIDNLIADIFGTNPEDLKKKNKLIRNIRIGKLTKGQATARIRDLALIKKKIYELGMPEIVAEIDKRIAELDRIINS